MDRPRADEMLATQLLLHLFGDLVETMQTLAPEGWKASEYYRLEHPTVERLHQEALQYHENLKDFPGNFGSPPTLEEVRAKFQEKPCYPKDESSKLLGECIWNIFSNNHTVISPQEEEYDLGSFRGSGRFIADFINQFYPSERVNYDYLDFYCAGWLHHQRTDLTNVYALLFHRLKEKNCEWIYTFPRTYFISLRQKEQDQPVEPEIYDPAKSLQKELENKKRQQELEAFQQSLDDDYEQRREEAKFRAPTQPVAAYHQVYGKWPKGWIF